MSGNNFVNALILFVGVRAFTAIVVIVKADDIVFTQVLSALNLNDDKRYLPRVFEAMVLADRNKGRLIDVDGLLAVAAGNKRRDPAKPADGTRLRRSVYCIPKSNRAVAWPADSTRWLPWE